MNSAYTTDFIVKIVKWICSLAIGWDLVGMDCCFLFTFCLGLVEVDGKERHDTHVLNLKHKFHCALIQDVRSPLMGVGSSLEPDLFRCFSYFCCTGPSARKTKYTVSNSPTMDQKHIFESLNKLIANQKPHGWYWRRMLTGHGSNAKSSCKLERNRCWNLGSMSLKFLFSFVRVFCASCSSADLE